MFRIAGVVVLVLSFCLPCRADTFADMWNSSGQSEHCFYLAGWLDGTRGICGSRSDDLCGLVKGNFELQSLERIVSIVYEIPLYWDVPYTTILGFPCGTLRAESVPKTLPAGSTRRWKGGRGTPLPPKSMPERNEGLPRPRRSPGLRPLRLATAAPPDRIPAVWKSF